MNTPMSEASSKWDLHRTWSMGDIVPSLAPLFWILIMLMRLERRITDMVPAMVFTVAGPFPIFNWSRLFITRSLKGPIFTNKRNARTPSTKITKNNNWIILLPFSKNKKCPLHYNSLKSSLLPNGVLSLKVWRSKSTPQENSCLNMKKNTKLLPSNQTNTDHFATMLKLREAHNDPHECANEKPICGIKAWVFTCIDFEGKAQNSTGAGWGRRRDGWSRKRQSLVKERSLNKPFWKKKLLV